MNILVKDNDKIISSYSQSDLTSYLLTDLCIDEYDSILSQMFNNYTLIFETVNKIAKSNSIGSKKAIEDTLIHIMENVDVFMMELLKNKTHKKYNIMVLKELILNNNKYKGILVNDNEIIYKKMMLWNGINILINNNYYRQALTITHIKDMLKDNIHIYTKVMRELIEEQRHIIANSPNIMNEINNKACELIKKDMLMDKNILLACKKKVLEQVIEEIKKSFSLDDEIKRVREEMKMPACVICMDNSRNILLLPCNHLVLCNVCADKCTKCPVCRAIIGKKNIIILS